MFTTGGKNINLGGRSTDTKRKAKSIVEETKFAREEREQHRKQQAAATKIQSWWRSLKQRRELKRALRSQWRADRLIEDLDAGLRQFLFFYTPSEPIDRSNLLSLVRTLNQIITKQPTEFVSRAFLSKESQLVWMYQMQRVLNLCHKALAESSDIETLTSFLAFIEFFVLYLDNISVNSSSDCLTCERLRYYFASQLVTGGFYESLYKIMSKISHLENPALLLRVISAWLQVHKITDINITSLLTMLTLELPAQALTPELCSSVEKTLTNLKNKQRYSSQLLFVALPSSETFLRNICSLLIQRLQSGLTDTNFLLLYFYSMVVPTARNFRGSSPYNHSPLVPFGLNRWMSADNSINNSQIYQHLRYIFSHPAIHALINTISSQSAPSNLTTENWQIPFESEAAVLGSLCMLLYWNYEDNFFMQISKPLTLTLLKILEFFENTNTIYLIANQILQNSAGGFKQIALPSIATSTSPTSSSSAKVTVIHAILIERTIEFLCENTRFALSLLDDQNFMSKTLNSKLKFHPLINTDNKHQNLITLSQILLKLSALVVERSESRNRIKLLTSSPSIISTCRILRELSRRDHISKFFPPNFWETSRKKLLKVKLEDFFHLYPFKVEVPPQIMEIDQSGNLSDSGRPQIVVQDLSNDMVDSSISSVVLRYMPFFLSIDEKFQILHYWLQLELEGENRADPSQGITVVIRRNFLVLDSFQALSKIKSDWRKNIKAEFINQEGLKEAGVGAGVFKEFLTSLIQEAFSPEYGLFTATKSSERDLYPNPNAPLLQDLAEEKFEFLGKVLGKLIYEKNLAELPLAEFFLKNLLGEPATVGDIAIFDKKIYDNIFNLLNLDDPQKIAQLDITFSTYNEEPITGVTQLIDLFPDGSSKEVQTTSDVILYGIAFMYHYSLGAGNLKHVNAFRKGVTSVLPSSWFTFFNSAELQVLISGQRGTLDLLQLRQHTKYSNGYFEEHNTIQLFWAVLEQFTPSEQAKFLKFVTSCSRPPLLGFRSLEPPFCIHQKTTPGLPSATTCVNQLKLPPFTDFNEMKEKLLYAIESESGFELS